MAILSQKMRKLIVLILVVLCCGAAWTARAAEPVKLQEDKIKSGLIYNFLKYTKWPDQAFATPSSPLQVCLLGGDSLSGTLDPLHGRTAQQRVISIQTPKTTAGITACHLVVIHHNQHDKIAAIVSAVSGSPILTLSDIDSFAQKGGMVELSTQADRRIHLYVNVDAIREAGMNIDNRLLQLAEKVR